ncbi:MAG: HDOD domain-containing protein [Planctomycetes bacterium]|nr:HDOD domain-containing protein [Planctomycetota bacterium]MCB9904234.1 HDOD domain-containing protein [Planctomycetota bacterium]
MAQPELARRVLEGTKNLTPWPEVASRVMQIAQRPEVVPGELVAVIQTDAALTAKVLRLANSAYYGFRREIASLAEAGNALGVQALVNLVLTGCAERYFHTGGRGAAAKSLWERSITTAFSAQILARAQGAVDPERAYTVALLQNIGHLVIDDFLVEFRERIEREQRDGRDLLSAERAVLGQNHAQIGARLARRWGFPEVLSDTIEFHHSPERAGVDPKLAAVAHLAETITYALSLDDGLESLAYGFSESALALSGLDRNGFLALEEVIREELEKARDVFESAA